MTTFNNQPSKVLNEISDAHRLIMEIACEHLEGLEGGPLNKSKLFEASMIISRNMSDFYKISEDYVRNKESFSDDLKENSVISGIVLKGLLDNLETLDDTLLEIDSTQSKELSIRAQRNVIKTALFWMEKYKGTLKDD